VSLGALLVLLLPTANARSAEYQFSGAKVSDTIEGVTHTVVVTTMNHGVAQTEKSVDIHGRGVIDVREITSPPSRIVYSVPSPKGYLKLEIEKRLSQGILKTEFVLSRNGQAYQLVRKRLHPYAVMNMPIGDCFYPPASPGDGIDPTQANAAVRSVVIGSSCDQQPFTADYNNIVNAVSSVMDAKNNELGSCMSGLGAGYYAGTMDEQFNELLNDPKNDALADSAKVVQCSKGAAGEHGVAGQYNEANDQISLDQTSAQMKGNKFGEVFFHESLHRAGYGMDQETLVRQIVSCCFNDPASACKDATNGMQQAAKNTASLIAAQQDMKGVSALMQTIDTATDESTADQIFLSLRQDLSAHAQTGNQAYQSCMSAKNGSAAKCSAAATQAAVKDVQSFFTKNCAQYFSNDYSKDAGQESASAIKADIQQTCATVTQEAVQVVEQNSSQDCSGKPASFDQSCLVNTHNDADQIYAQMMSDTPQSVMSAASQGKALYAPLITVTDNPQEAQVMNSYLSGLSHDMGGSIMGIVAKMKSNTKPGEQANAVSMMETWFSDLNEMKKSVNIAGYIQSCESQKGATPASCGKNLEQVVDTRLQTFFSKSCPSFFATDSAFKAACGNYEKQFQGYIDKSVQGGCKTQSGRAAMPSVVAGNLDFSCLNAALSAGQQCAALSTADFGAGCAQVVGGTQNVVDATTDLWLMGNGKNQKTAAQGASQGPASAGTILSDPAATTTVFDPHASPDAQEAYVASSVSTIRSVIQSAAHYMESAVPSLESQALAASGTGSAALAASNLTPTAGWVTSPAAGAAPYSAHGAGASTLSPSVNSGVAGGGVGDAQASADSAAQIAAAQLAANKASFDTPNSGASAGSGAVPSGNVGAASPISGGGAAVNGGASSPAGRSAGGSSAGAGEPSAAAGTLIASDSPELVSFPPADPVAGVPTANEVRQVGQKIDLSLLNDPAHFKGALAQAQSIPHVLVIDAGVRSGDLHPWVIFSRQKKGDPFRRYLLTNAGWIADGS
jgi:hypothetical protein